MKTLTTLTFDDAERAAAAAREKASSLSLAVSVALVDLAGQIVHISRMDGARGYSVDLALRKARTSASIGFPTSVLADALKGQSLSSEVLAVPGGMPVKSNGDVAGAIGVSGATTDADEAIAAAGLAALAT